MMRANDAMATAALVLAGAAAATALSARGGPTTVVVENGQTLNVRTRVGPVALAPAPPPTPASAAPPPPPKERPRARDVPTRVRGLPRAIALDAALDRTCAVAEDGTVWCWGDVDDPRYDATTNPSVLEPERATWASGAVEIALGEGFACALSIDHRVRCSPEDHTPPDLPDAKHIDAGDSNVCAILVDGSVRCRGHSAQSPTIDAEGRTVWTTTPALWGVRDIDVGEQSFALMGDGSLRWWGPTNACTGRTRIVPELLLGIVGARAVGAPCAVTASGGVTCWSYDGGGAPSMRAQPYAPPPTRQPLAGVRAIAPGGVDATCAVHDDGRVSCWGANTQGMLGDPSFERSDVPLPIAAWGRVRTIALGMRHACALTTNGEVLCAGSNEHGQLGLGAGD